MTVIERDWSAITAAKSGLSKISTSTSDEPIIAADLSAIVSGWGHEVVGVARTHTEATAHGADQPADLILADI